MFILNAEIFLSCYPNTASPSLANLEHRAAPYETDIRETDTSYVSGPGTINDAQPPPLALAMISGGAHQNAAGHSDSEPLLSSIWLNPSSFLDFPSSNIHFHL